MRTKRHNERGALTLVALSLTTVIGIALAGYIALSYQSLQHSQRTLQMSRTRQLAETGLEEALWSLNNSDWSNAVWTVSGSTKSCTVTGYTLGEGATGQVAVSISNYSTDTPTITSVATVTPATGAPLAKTLVATTKPAPMFPNAIGISADNNGRVRFNSGGTIDSWNSNPSGDNATWVGYSWSGATSNFDGTVAAPNITVGTATINGYATTFGNSITTGGTSKVKGPSTPGGTNIDMARVGKSAFVPFYPVAIPTPYSITGWLDGSGQTIGHPNHGTEEVYYCNGLNLSGVTLTVQGPVIIVVNGDLTVFNAAIIQVNAAGGARLEMFVSGDVSIGTSPHGSLTWLKNLTNEPRNFIIYSTSTTSWRMFNYYNNHDFCGILYSASPSAPISIDTGTNNVFSGAILAQYDVSFASGTTPTFHYDTSLQNLPRSWFSGVTTPFIVMQVTES